MSAALQNQPPVVGGQPPVPQPVQGPEQITPEMLMEIFAIGEEEARRILEALPQLCAAATPQIQQGAELTAIQQGVDIANFQSFMNLMNSPYITDQERQLVFSLDKKTLFEVVKNTGMLIDAGTPTMDAMTRMTWSDKAKENITATQVAEWIFNTLVPEVIEPLAMQQEQMGQAIMQMAQMQAMRQQAGAGQGIGMGGPPQGMNQQQQQPQQTPQGRQMPWTNSKGDSLWYKMFKDSTGKKTIMADTLQMDITEDTIKIDDDGVLTGDAVMTAAMVQTYMKDGKEQKVLKDPGELQKACDAWYPLGMPCTDQHPEDGMVMNQDEKVGWTTMPIWDAENNNVRCQITITDGNSVKKIQDGNTDVSIGFFCDLDDSPGTFQDAEYEAVQRNIVFNHLAVGLDKGNGRCPDGTCGITTTPDKKDETEIDWEKYNHLPCVGDTHYDWLMKDTEDAKTGAEQIAALPDSAFAGPGRTFPIHDCGHYTAALNMLPRYEGPGDKQEIKDSIIERGKKLDCPGAEDEEMTLHKQLLEETTTALVEMSKKLAEEATEMSSEDLEDLMSGMRELMYRLRDEIQIVKGRGIAVETEMLDAAIIAYGDAEILQHSQEVAAESTTVTGTEYQLMPGRPDTHDHFVTLNAEGNGISTENNDHVHMVEMMQVQLAESHSHGLLAKSSQEETPMSDEEKLKAKKDKAEKEAADKVAADKAAAEKAAEEPITEAPSEDEAESTEEKPEELDEASQYVADMIKAEHTKLVDAIMDRKPKQEREFYEKKSLDELKELTEFLDSVAPVDNSIPAGKGKASDSTVAIDDAYAEVESKL